MGVPEYRIFCKCSIRTRFCQIIDPQ